MTYKMYTQKKHSFHEVFLTYFHHHLTLLNSECYIPNIVYLLDHQMCFLLKQKG